MSCSGRHQRPLAAILAAVTALQDLPGPVDLRHPIALPHGVVLGWMGIWVTGLRRNAHTFPVLPTGAGSCRGRSLSGVCPERSGGTRPQGVPLTAGFRG